jgi:hypothetical protein
VWFLIALLSRASAVPPEGWDLVGLSNNIEVARQSIQGSPLFAFRGETVTDIHISVLAGLLIKDSLGTEWVDLMSQSYMVERVGPDTKIVRQVYDLPWPVQDRDYVMRQDAAYDLDGKVFTLHFQSIDSGLEPVNDCCVRAEATRTYWRLQQLPDGRTQVAVEVITDPRGSLPSWLINLIQQDWPSSTVTGLLTRAAEGGFAVDSKTASW